MHFGHDIKLLGYEIVIHLVRGTKLRAGREMRGECA
jgi:hypothetical protein